MIRTDIFPEQESTLFDEVYVQGLLVQLGIQYSLLIFGTIILLLIIVLIIKFLWRKENKNITRTIEKLDKPFLLKGTNEKGQIKELTLFNTKKEAEQWINKNR